MDEIRARAAQDLANQAAYASAPGGTPEDRPWEVLMLMGAGESAPAEWSGTFSITAGDVFEIHGYRTELPDRILPQGGWQIQTKIEKVLESSPIEGGGQPESVLLPKGVLVRGSGTETTRIEVRTKQGDCTFSPMRVAFGAPEKCLGGRIEVNRVPAATDLSGTELRQHDFPAIGAGPEGTLWATWSSFHDRREELNFRRYQAGKWTRLIPVGRATEDLWRPQVVTDGANKPWLIWSEQERGNWDIYAMPWEDNEWGARVRLSEEPTPDIEPHVARGADGTIYVVWQALSGRWSHIRMRYLKDGKWSPADRGDFGRGRRLGAGRGRRAERHGAGSPGTATRAITMSTRAAFSPPPGFRPNARSRPRRDSKRTPASPWIAQNRAVGRMGSGRRQLGQGSGRGARRQVAGHAAGRPRADRSRCAGAARAAWSSTTRSGAGAQKRQRSAAVRRSERQSLAVVQAPLQPRGVSPEHVLGDATSRGSTATTGRRPIPLPRQLDAQVDAHGAGSDRRAAVGVLAVREPQLGVRQPSARESRDRRIAAVAGQRRRASAELPSRRGQAVRTCLPHETRGRRRASAQHRATRRRAATCASCAATCIATPNFRRTSAGSTTARCPSSIDI